MTQRPAATRLMLLSFAMACLLHADRAPLWATVAAASGLGWHWLHAKGRLELPRRPVRLVLTALLLAGVINSFGTLNGLAAGSTLLIAMGSVKLLETRGARDMVVVATVALILVLAAALDRQSLSRMPLYLATVWLALATLAAMGSHVARAQARPALRLAGGAMLAAIPFAVLAFVLVPRLPGALWSLPGGDAARTGLSEEMSPGSISELALSDEMAFQVRFEGEAPPMHELYWRGPVLHDFDGFTWRGSRYLAVTTPRVEFNSPPVRYEVMLEPHGMPYLFALDAVDVIEGPRHRRAFNGQVLAYLPVTSPTIYRAVSHTSWSNPGPLSILGRQLDTRLPEGRNPRTLELARTLRAQSGSDADYAQRVMRFFGSGGYEYSLTPPALQRDSVDDLLFNTRLGFCGHFASAFVTMMRAVDIPARVVTGYLGGTWNPIGEFYAVRQSDAHAWAEVWLEGRGWTRFDPTAMVAPERLQQSPVSFLTGARSGAAALLQKTSLLRMMRDGWDAAGSWWQKRVVQFNAARQRDLLSKLGLGRLDYRGMGALLLAGALAWGAVLLWLAARRPRVRPDAIGRTWQAYCAVLARHGLQVQSHEGPEAVRRRAAMRWPGAAPALERFTRTYADLRFGRTRSGMQPDAALRAALDEVRRALRSHPGATSPQSTGAR